MIKFFSRNKKIFYVANFTLIFIYLYPGSLIGQVIHGSTKMQPQITPDFVISSNHFYVFILLSIIGFLTFVKIKEVKILISYLVILSLSLELFHLIIPQRTFQWSDLFGNFLGVIVVILIRNLINKHGLFKK